MASATLNYSSITSATGWVNATTAILASTSSNDFATDGRPAEFIQGPLQDTPTDFGIVTGTIALIVRARISSGSLSRQKQVFLELLNSAGTTLGSGTTANLTTTATDYTINVTGNTNSKPVADGWQLRATVQEGSGMSDSITVEIDRLYVTVIYTAPTVVTRYVNPGSTGGNGTTNALSGTNAAYASLNSAMSTENATRSNLVSRNEQLFIECAGGADTTSVSDTTWTSDIVHYVKVYAEASNVATPLWSTSKYRLSCNITSFEAARITIDYFQLQGLQIEVTGTASTSTSFLLIPTVGNPFRYTCTGSYIRVINDNGSDGFVVGAANTSTGTCVFVNNIFDGYIFNSGIRLGTTTSLTIIGYNNLFHNCFNGIGGSLTATQATYRLINNRFDGCTTEIANGDSSDTFNYNTTNNSSFTSGLPTGTGNLASRTYSYVGSGDYHLASGDPGIGAGFDLSSDSSYAVTTDMDGDPRTAPFDIGPDEAIAAIRKLINEVLDSNDSRARRVQFRRALADILHSNEIRLRLLSLQRLLAEGFNLDETSSKAVATQLLVRLMEGAAERASFVVRPTSTLADFTYDLTTTERNNISNWSNLQFEFQATSDLNERPKVTAARLETPSAVAVMLYKVISATLQLQAAASRQLLLSRPTAEELSLEETNLRQVLLRRAQAATLSLNEAASRLRDLRRPLAEALQLHEALLARRQLQRAFAETLQLVETTQRKLDLSRALQEQLQHDEHTTRLLALARQLAETESLADAPARQALLQRLQAETLELGESAAHVQLVLRVLQEALTLTDQQTSLLELRRAEAETLSLEELQASLLRLQRQVSTLLQLQETPQRLLELLRTSNESLDNSEALVTWLQLWRSIQEAEQGIESIVKLRQLFRALHEQQQTLETETKRLDLLRSLHEQLSSVEISSRRAEFFRVIAEVLRELDNPQTNLLGLVKKVISEALHATEVRLRKLELRRTKAESQSVQEIAQTRTVLGRALSATLALLDSANRRLLLNRLKQEQQALQESSDRELRLLRAISAHLSLSESDQSVRWLRRLQQESLALQDTVTANLVTQLIKVVTETLTNGATASKLLQLYRQLAEAEHTEEAALTRAEFNRVLGETLSQVDIKLHQIVLYRLVQEALHGVETVKQARQLVQVVAETLALVAGSTTLLELQRVLKEFQQMTETSTRTVWLRRVVQAVVSVAGQVKRALLLQRTQGETLRGQEQPPKSSILQELLAELVGLGLHGLRYLGTLFGVTKGLLQGFGLHTQRYTGVSMSTYYLYKDNDFEVVEQLMRRNTDTGRSEPATGLLGGIAFIANTREGPALDASLQVNLTERAETPGEYYGVIAGSDISTVLSGAESGSYFLCVRFAGYEQWYALRLRESRV